MNVEKQENLWSLIPSDLFLPIITKAIEPNYPWLRYGKACQLSQVCTAWKMLLNQTHDLCRFFKIPPMHQAAMVGDVDTIVKLKLNGQSPLAPDRNGNPPLLYALATNQSNAIMALKMHMNIGTEDIKEIKEHILTMKEASLQIINAPNPIKYVENDLCEAIKNNNYEKLLEILSSDYKGPISNPYAFKNPNPLLCLIKYFLQRKAESFLLSRLISNKNLNHTFFEKFTQLQANPNAYDTEGLTFIHHASSDNDLLPTLQRLLKIEGCDINRLNLIKKYSPLQWSIKNNAFKCTKYLIKKGADGNKVCKNKNSILHTTIKYHEDNLKCLNLLFKSYKSLIDNQNNLGDTPLILAIKKDYFSTVFFLIKQGADLNITAHNGCTALHYAVMSKKPDYSLIRFLLDHEVKVDSSCYKNMCVNKDKEYDGQHTPLHLAVIRGDKECIKILLDYKADKNLKTQLGKTTLDLAQEYNHQEIIQLLS